MGQTDSHSDAHGGGLDPKAEAAFLMKYLFGFCEEKLRVDI